jgi:D-aminoacyl-tRNA deacylase
MRAVIQRVHRASVEVEGEVVGAIQQGLVAFVASGSEDTDQDLAYCVSKLLGLRVFQDEQGKMNRSIQDIQGELLIVSQFTLYGDVRKGKRPSFTSAMHPSQAEPLLEKLVTTLRSHQLNVETGRFGADMRVQVDNDGPVTILIDSTRLF